MSMFKRWWSESPYRYNQDIEKDMETAFFTGANKIIEILKRELQEGTLQIADMEKRTMALLFKDN